MWFGVWPEPSGKGPLPSICSPPSRSYTVLPITVPNSKSISPPCPLQHASTYLPQCLPDIVRLAVEAACSQEGFEESGGQEGVTGAVPVQGLSHYQYRLLSALQWLTHQPRSSFLPPGTPALSCMGLASLPAPLSSAPIVGLCPLTPLSCFLPALSSPRPSSYLRPVRLCTT